MSTTNETDVWESITKENVEAEIEKHKLIEPDYESDDDRRVFLKLKITILKSLFIFYYLKKKRIK